MGKFINAFLFVLICSNSIIAQNYYYSLQETQETTTPIKEVRNVNELISELKSDANLYLLPGTYTLQERINLKDIYNLNITGADNVVIQGKLENLIRFEEDAENISFNNIVFKSTSTAKATDYGGLIYFNNANARNIHFEVCTFSCPNTDTNGLKFVSQGPYRSKKIVIINCTFQDIGRMAIETVNHDYDDVFRMEDVTVKDCYFNNLGTKSKYGMAISLSGTGKNAEITDNIIIDAKDRAIENVAWNNVLIQNNELTTVKNAYNPISMNRRAGGSLYMKDVIVKGNSGKVTGNSPHLIELYHLDGLEYSNNNFSADALHLNDVKNSSFRDNFHSSDGGIGLYVEYKSNSNTFYDNTLISVRNYATTVHFFEGATANTLENNEIIKKGAGGTVYLDEDGGNINLDLTN